MIEKIKAFFGSNTAVAKLLRTILQGVLGVLISYVPQLISGLPIDPAIQTLIVPVVMAILSPIMAWLGEDEIKTVE